MDTKWRPYYRIIEQTSSLNYKIKSQLDNSVIKVHANQIRHANIDDWPLPTVNTNRRIRRAQLAVAPDLSSDFDSSIINDGTNDRSTTPLPPITKQVGQQRDNSNDEDDIPLAELQKHLRNKSNTQPVPDCQSDSSSNSTSDSSNDNVSDETEMCIDAITRRQRKLRRSTSKKSPSRMDSLKKCMSVMLASF